MFFNDYNAVVFNTGALQSTALNDSLGSISLGFTLPATFVPCSAAPHTPKTPVSSYHFYPLKSCRAFLEECKKQGRRRTKKMKVMTIQKRERLTSSVGYYRAWAKRPRRRPEGDWWLSEGLSVRTMARAEPGGWTEEEMGIWAMWGQEFEGETR